MNNTSLQRFAWSALAAIGMYVSGFAIAPIASDTSDYQAAIITEPAVLGYIFPSAGIWDVYRVGQTIDRGDVVFSTYDSETKTGTGMWRGKIMDYEIMGSRTYLWRYTSGGSRPVNHTFELEYDDETEQIFVYKREDPTTLHRELRTDGDIVYPELRSSEEIKNEVYRGSVPKCWMNNSCVNGFGVQEEPTNMMPFREALMRRHMRNQYYQRMWFWSDYVFPDGTVMDDDIFNF